MKRCLVCGERSDVQRQACRRFGADLGAPRRVDPRAVVNTIPYRAWSGGALRLPPKDFAPFSAVRKHFDRWRDEGVLGGIDETLLRAAREREGRKADPTAGVIDRRSARTTREGGPRGFDAGKKVMGRRRHIVVDTPGLMAGRSIISMPPTCNRDGAPLALSSVVQRRPGLRHIRADGAHAGPKLKAALEKVGRFTSRIVKRSDPVKGFEILPRRWVVERTFARLGRCRRPAGPRLRATIASAEPWIRVANIPPSRQTSRKTPASQTDS